MIPFKKMINLTKFNTIKSVTVPVMSNEFKYNSKKYKVKVDDGWYEVNLLNNDVVNAKPTYVMPETRTNLIKGYTCGNNIIFQDFNSAKRKYGIGIRHHLYLNNVPTFSSVIAEVNHNKIVLIGINYNDVNIYTIKQAFDDEVSITDLKGVTPELRTLYLFHNLERERVKLELLKETEEYKEKTTFDIVKDMFKNAGATITNYWKEGRSILVDWNLGGHNFNSKINADTLMIEDAGYCCSGADTKFNPTSLVRTAKEYNDQGLIYITRTRD